MGDSNLSQTSICNSALLKVGADLISSLSDGSRAANILSAIYPTIRDVVLADAPWRFATAQIQITPLAASPTFDYTYEYQLPSDCLRPLDCEIDTWTVITGGLLVCNSPGPLNLTYIQKNTNESTWDPHFAEAFATRLARELALALVQSVPLKDDMDKTYMMQIKEARAMNSVVGSQKRLIADIWSSARKGYTTWLAPVTSGLSEPYGQ